MLDYYKHAEHFLKQLPKGVFMTVKAGDVDNTMTIAWGHIGIIWGKPVFVAYVRYSRYTYDLLRNAKDFTINVPEVGTLSEALTIAGSKSGRNINKFQEAQLTLKPGKQTISQIIAECKLHYECDIIYTQTMEPALIPEDVKQRYYPQHDTHIVFYGEIIESYTLD